MFGRSKSQKGPKRSTSQSDSSPSKDKPPTTKTSPGHSKTSPSHSGSGFFGSGMTSSLPKSIFSMKSRKNSGSKENIDKGVPPSQNIHSNSSSNLPVDTMQSMSTSYSLSHSGSGSGLLDGLGSSSGVGSPNSSKSPYNSPTNSLNVKVLKDRYERDHGQGFLMMSDRSLDRHVDRLAFSSRGELVGASPTSSPRSSFGLQQSSNNNSRDRSLDREYPHMGARSLERDHNFGRSRSSERPDYTTQLFHSHEMKNFRDQEMRNYRDTLILDFQAQIADLNKECAKLQQELDSTKDKLSSSMNSIKTFWSPELKKERALRKEESAKYCLLNEQLKVAQAELKKQNATVRDLESQLLGCEDAQAITQISQTEIELLQREKEKQAKEIVILRKTVEEMEIRIETQKQTLSARDESMKKLLEMLQSKGLSNNVQKMEAEREEIEKLQTQVLESERKIRQLESSLDQSDKEAANYKEENSRLADEIKQMKLELKHQPASTHTMQAMLEAKDSRISALEKELQGLEDKFMRAQEEGAGTTEREKKDGSLKDSLSSKEKTFKNEIENLKKELVNKDTEIKGWKLKFEAFGSQHGEHQQYIGVLKDQITAKEQHISILQADIEDLRDRLKDKDSTIDKKAKHSYSLQTEKRKIEGEIGELKDQLEHKDKKISSLMKKIEAIEESLDDREEQILQLKAAAVVASTVAESNSTDSAISSMEESLHDKERQIEKLKETRERVDQEHREECEMYMKSNQELKARMEALQVELTDKQTELCELREQAAEGSSQKFQSESKVRQLESKVEDQTSEIQRLEIQLEQLKTSPGPMNMASLDKQVVELTSQVEQARNEANKMQAEVERLKGLVSDAEKDKEEKENRIKEQEDLIKEYRQKVGTLKRNKQAEKKKNAHLLEEARKREGEMSDDATQLQSTLTNKNDRIEELEEALKESVKITAEREMAMAEQQAEMEDCKLMVDELKEELKKQKSLDQSERIVLLNKQLEEKDHKLRRLQSERHKHLAEVYEMKQEAILAAISEKDANIALLEMTSTKKQRNTEEMEKLNKEKEKLQQQLKDLTKNQMKLIHKQEKRSDGSRGRKAHRSRSASTEKVDPYVLTAPESLETDSREFYNSASATM